MVHFPKRVVPRPDAVRKIARSFGWLDHRLLRDGFLSRLAPEDLGVYVFLVLAANAQGVSWYRKEKICDALGLAWDRFHQARDRLIERGLIAFEPFRDGDVNGYYQVLPLPERSDA